MQVNYVFTYKVDGNPNKMQFISSIVMDENVDAALMERYFYTLVENTKEFKDMGIIPRYVKLLSAYCPSSTRFPKFEYPVSSTSSISSSISATDTRITDYTPNTFPEQKEDGQYYTYTYEGKFMRSPKGTGELPAHINILLSFTERKPLVLNEWLINQFKEAFEKESKDFGWELVGVTLVKTNPTGSYSDPTVFHPHEPYEMYWVRVTDESQKEKNAETWIPGFYQNGKMWSAIGELTSPESPEDTRPFDKSPWLEYAIMRRPD